MISNELEPGVDLVQKARQETTYAQEQIAEVLLSEESNADTDALDEEPAEPYELEDYGDSEVTLFGRGAQTPYDSENDSQLPLLKQLPRRARPRVLYQIDKELNVHRLSQGDNTTLTLSHIIACAIANHIRASGITLSAPGDWRDIPALRNHESLYELVPNNEMERVLKRKLKSLGTEPKAFAIQLYNGDVITPQALLEKAQVGKRATRSGALRTAAIMKQSGTVSAELLDVCEIAGEAWNVENWARFYSTQETKMMGQRKKPEQGRKWHRGRTKRR